VPNRNILLSNGRDSLHGGAERPPGELPGLGVPKIRGRVVGEAALHAISQGVGDDLQIGRSLGMRLGNCHGRAATAHPFIDDRHSIFERDGRRHRGLSSRSWPPSTAGVRGAQAAERAQLLELERAAALMRR